MRSETNLLRWMAFHHSCILRIRAFYKLNPLCAAHAVAFTAEPTLQPCLPWEHEFALLCFSWLPDFTQLNSENPVPAPQQVELDKNQRCGFPWGDITKIFI